MSAPAPRKRPPYGEHGTSPGHVRAARSAQAAYTREERQRLKREIRELERSIKVLEQRRDELRTRLHEL